ncbi:hypothetical protein K491DRAFT_690976 [Lophiostoma macrostomum CBS 122681]|uniref:26S proteasome complex subunit SEM1 n=1 Tax=Lophiostoma macrostomum CBS 122681 TaxID=1314788 RepID=A0A6A6TC17_9PLEO|nr:hypothetical protein K491DRAFT_690976 [Lophiostoma macrostomum CBS 122681]
MSAQGTSTSTTKAAASDNKNGEPATEQKPAAPLEEDDEFEDFPLEDWPEEESQLPGGNAHLWEESWDDDDTNEEFAVQLREELKKLQK